MSVKKDAVFSSFAIGAERKTGLIVKIVLRRPTIRLHTMRQNVRPERLPSATLEVAQRQLRRQLGQRQRHQRRPGANVKNILLRH